MYQTHSFTENYKGIIQITRDGEMSISTINTFLGNNFANSLKDNYL